MPAFPEPRAGEVDRPVEDLKKLKRAKRSELRIREAAGEERGKREEGYDEEEDET